MNSEFPEGWMTTKEAAPRTEPKHGKPEGPGRGPGGSLDVLTSSSAFDGWVP